MLAEGEDKGRRDGLRRARGLRPHGVTPEEFLAFLSGAARLFQGNRAGPRRRPQAGGRYHL